MENFFQLIVDDTSPTISYSPFRDTLSVPNLSAGWNPYYDQSGFASSIGEVGNGTSLHITSLDGASLGFQWHGTGIQLEGNVTLASYAVTIDGQTISATADGNVLVNVTGLEDATHNITLTARIPQGQNPPNSSMLVFDKAVITSSPILDSSNVISRNQTIDDNEIAFLGRWSFETAPSGFSFHTSKTVGDRALTAFNGSTFLLQGITSPTASNYTVTIDNETSGTLIGQSSFTSYDSLLFFASGLNPNGTHSVEVRNVGSGELSLQVDGFRVFLPDNLSPLPPSSTPAPVGTTSSMSFPKGTIAAFILAGILAFLLLLGILFFFLFYRPRRRQRRLRNHFSDDQFTQSPKEREAGMVLDISANAQEDHDKHMDIEEDEISSSEFRRWRRGAVHGSLGGVSLPIKFRNSGSTEQKDSYGLEERPGSDMSDLPPSSNSSAKRKARAKSKGKARQITGRSWSPSIKLSPPSIKLALPIRQVRSQNSQNLSPTTRITSWGAVSSFVAADPSPQEVRNPDPPSYAASVSNRGSNNGTQSSPSSAIPSGPRSVTESPAHPPYQPVHYRDTSAGFLLQEGEPSSDQDSPEAQEKHPQYPTPSRVDVIPMMPLSRHDGSTHMSEDNPSIIEPSNLREVIRSLSPRTSEAPHRQSRWQEDGSGSSMYESPTDILPPIESIIIQHEPNRRSSRPLPQIPGTDEDNDSVEVQDGIFLDVRATSPFHVDFDSRSARIAMRSASNDSNADGPYHSSRKASRKSSAMTNVAHRSIASQLPEFVQGPSRLQFRLTPMTPPPQLSSSNNSDGVTSFLDLTGSGDASMRSGSIRTGSDNERRISESLLSVPGINEPRSRWSNTTVPTISTNAVHQASETSSSGRSQEAVTSDVRSTDDSSMFPFSVHVDIPPSPHHIMDISSSNRRSQTSGFTQAGAPLHVHPAMENFESPTESIPMSVSDLHFRHSESEGNSRSPRTTEASLSFSPANPVHPPLPGSSTDEYPPRAIDPSIVVNRSLALASSSPTPTGVGFTQSTSESSAAFPVLSSTSQRPNLSHEHLDTSGPLGHG